MELSRQEYPNLLTTLQPSQAVTVLNDRIKQISKVNSDIADWLQERRRVEELYVAGLRKLARRPQQDGAAALGIFQLPWQRIITSTESIASSHEILANKIEVDVEKPLRDYATKNREMQSMSTIQGNLGSIAKDFEKAQERSDKLKTKTGKANKVASANMSVEDASVQWESQAPYVFEQLQSVDENRLNHLRDVLTQFQTHEADQVERNRVTAEGTLNALLNVETADEIKTFAARIVGERGGIPRRMSQPRQPSVGGGAASALQPPVPTRSNEDGFSERSGSAGGQFRTTPVTEPPIPMQKHSGLGGLKRLGTVIGGRRKSMIVGGSSMGTPEREKRSFRPFGRRGESEQSIPSTPSRGALTTITSNEERPRSESIQTPSQPPEFPRQYSQRELPRTPDPDAIEPAPLANQGPTTNGIITNNHVPLEPALQPISPTQAASLEFQPPPGPPPDSHGFSSPPPATDEISRAQAEAAAVDPETMPYNLHIRDKPIQEEDDEAQKAMNEMANTLRSQAQLAPTRKQGTVRGRREVRNTVFIPSAPLSTTEQSAPESAMGPLSPPTSLQTPATAMPGEDRTTAASDTTSIRSAQTLTTHPLVVHPEMHSPGLNASIVETVSTWYSNGQVTKSSVFGEMALVHNPTASATGGFSFLDTQAHSQTIRLDNFHLLEKVAANPIIASPSTSPVSPSGVYTVSLSQVTHKAHAPIAFKYQIHLDESSLSSYSPVVLTPHWKIEPSQASVIVTYSINPSFAITPGTASVTLKNVLLTINLAAGPVHATTALMQPEGGFRKNTSTVYWKLPELVIEAKPKRLIARFKTEGEGEAKAGSIEARWEGPGLGSALGVSVSASDGPEGRDSGEKDPFADESVSPAVEKKSEGEWKQIAVERRLVSGKYVAE